MYKGLLYATFGGNNFCFDAIFDLIGRLKFSTKKSTLANRDRKEIKDAEKAKEIIDTTTFVELPDLFEQQIADDLFKDLEHKKTKHPYLEPRVKDAQTIETETQVTNNEFSQLKQEFDKVNNAAAEQKSHTDAMNLIDDILDEDNPFNNVETEDTWIEDDIFNNDNTQTIKNVSKEITDVTDPIETIVLPDDDFKRIETITIEDDIDIPSDDSIAIDALKKIKITDPNRLRLASNKMKKKYLRQKSKCTLKKANKKAADWLKKAGLLRTDDLETIDYNNDTSINDRDNVKTINYNDTNLSGLDNINLKKTSGAQIAAKKIVKKYRNLARKKPY